MHTNKSDSKYEYKPIFFKEEDLIGQNNIHISDLSSLMKKELMEITKNKIHESEIPSNIVFYPWLYTYYKILNEADFITVRTSRNKNKITQPESLLLQNKSVGIVGQSTGSQLAYILAQERICGHLLLVDADTISLSNLNRIRCSISQVGKPKTLAIAQSIAELDPYLSVDIINDNISPNNSDIWLPMFKDVDVLVDACDDIKVKILLRLFAKKLKKPILMETNDKGRIDIERFDLEDRPIFHGGFKQIDENRLQELESTDLFSHLVKLFNQTGGLSKRMMDSLPLIGKTLLSYPQLASETVSGAATLATCIRAIFLNKSQASGVFFVDLENAIQKFEQKENKSER